MRPTTTPIYADILADALADIRDDEGDRPFAIEDTRIRHSWSGFCSRAIFYKIKGVEETEPHEEGDLYRFFIGQLLHDAYQSALKNRYGDDCELEVKVQLDDMSSGHIDAVVMNQGVKDAIEIKSINGVGYRKAVGADRDGPKGPRSSAIIQGSVNAYAAEADRMVIVYLPTENISKATIDRYKLQPDLSYRAEWVVGKDDFTHIAKQEIARWRDIIRRVEDDLMVPRYLPEEDGVVINPSTGSYQKQVSSSQGGGVYTGKTWMCNYCAHQTHCAGDI